jgi:two-component system phosphate regulon sensor histidine kinase PhoR
MGEVALRMAKGDFSSRVNYPLADELGLLGDSLDHLSQELSEKIRLLTEEKTRLATILSSMAEGVLMVDARGQVGLVNEATQQMFGLGEAELAGKAVSDVIAAPELLRAFERTRALRAPAFEECFIVRGNDRRDLLISSTPIEEHGRLLGMVAVLNDISQVRRLERVRRDFVANVSHELRTPLSVVRGYAETLLSAPMDLPEMAVEFVETILRHTIRLSRLIDDLLTLAAIEGRGLDSQLGPLDAGEAVDEVIDLLSKLADDRQITVRVEGFERLPLVRAEARALRHVLTNLLDNAIKYTQPGGEVSVVATHALRQRAVTVAVSDTGPGIAPEHLPRIFERFYRVDAGRSREVGGSGLGLSLVKHLVHTLGASIDVRSAVGQGTTFTLTLPCAQASG